MNQEPFFSFGGVVPRVSLKAELGPPRSECGVGALMAWADRLWAIAYVSHKGRSGVGTGLYEIRNDFTLHKHPDSVTGTFANRMVHYESNQLFMGPHAIDAQGNVRTIPELKNVRATATMRHLFEPKTKVYTLGMEGELFEVDVDTLACRQVMDLTEELQTPKEGRVHFKAGHTAYGRVVVGNNTYDESSYLGNSEDGRLAEWDGKTWTILERKPVVEITSRGERINANGQYSPAVMFASGWDRASAFLSVFEHQSGGWTRYRLPKASHTFDHMWTTEWPRIREVDHQRFLMDCHGMFYELSAWVYGGRVWGVRPISTHLAVLGDFCSWRGTLVMGMDNASPARGHNAFTGEPQGGLWFGKTDDLWAFGKPKGWGGPWWKDAVRRGEPSDPYLMTGFDRKCLNLQAAPGRGRAAFTVEADFLGCGEWTIYETLETREDGSLWHTFPEGFSAHWVRIIPHQDGVATAHFHYS